MTPGSDVLQFVENISATPTVLLDLNSGAPIYLARDGWSAPPPRLKRAVLESSARDGSTVPQTAYSDRELVITVGLDTASRDAAATAIQNLARMLDSDGRWLMYKTATAPVFFRTKRAEIEALAEFNGRADGFREVTLRIPAEPFAYGLPVTGSTAIANDPTAATNPMSFVMPAIQGDVRTSLSFKLSDSGVIAASMLAVTANSTSAPPIFREVNTGAFLSTGWAGTTFSDSTAIGGATARFTRSSGALGTGIPLKTAADTIPPGDYRIVIRARSSVAGARVGIARAPGSTASAATSLGTTWQWVDCGVWRLPTTLLTPKTPALSPLFATTAANVLVNASIPASSTGTVDVDRLAFVPAGLDLAKSTTLGLVNQYGSSGTDIYVDGVNEMVSTGYGDNVSLFGGFPAALPNSTNTISLVRVLGAVGDVKTLNTTVNYFYYPRYLYIRPATS